MARLSKEERAELEARLAADDDDDDGDREASVTIGDMSFTGAFRDAVKFAAAHGRKLIPDPPAADDSDKTKSNVKRFQTGRRVS